MAGILAKYFRPEYVRYIFNFFLHKTQRKVATQRKSPSACDMTWGSLTLNMKAIHENALLVDRNL